jgi:hypothetical protein
MSASALLWAGWGFEAVAWALILTRRASLAMWVPWFAAMICWTVRDLMERNTGSYIVDALVLLFGLWWVFRKPKNRKRVKDMIGAKSRALRDALVRTMRELQPSG